MVDSSDAAKEAMAIAKAIAPMLAGRGPDVQGAVIAQLAATWLAGHPRALLVPALQLWLNHVVSLADIEARRMGTG